MSLELSSFHRKRYGQWAGRPEGNPADPSRCCETVHERGRGALFYQCTRKRGFGPEKAYCKQHDPSAVAARNAIQKAAYEKEMAIHHLKWNGRKVFDALQKIADGHNDPRGLALETIAETAENLKKFGLL